MNPIKAKIASLMADNRERTAADVAHRLKSDEAVIRGHLTAMAQMGLLTSDRIQSSGINLTAWRKA